MPSAFARRGDAAIRLEGAVFDTPGVPGPYQDLAESKIGAQEAERRAVAAALSGKALAGSVEAKKEADEKKLPTFKD